jgi:DeoR family fructose operon transcriptional repressor
MNMGQPLFAEERQHKIIELLNRKSKVNVLELTALFDVSAATVRSDLRQLEKEGKLIRTHGGALPDSKASFEPATVAKRDININVKKRLAAAAADLIEENDTIILDAGTTTYQLAKLITQRSLTVVTNDLEIARQLADSQTVTTIMLGGVIRPKVNCTIGSPSLAMLKELSVDRAFMGTNSFSLSKGATTPNLDQAAVKKAMIGCAAEVVLLCSQRKMGRASFAQFASMEEIDSLVIDTITEEQRRKLAEYHTQVIIAAD